VNDPTLAPKNLNPIETDEGVFCSQCINHPLTPFVRDTNIHHEGHEGHEGIGVPKECYCRCDIGALRQDRTVEIMPNMAAMAYELLETNQKELIKKYNDLCGIAEKLATEKNEIMKQLKAERQSANDMAGKIAELMRTNKELEAKQAAASKFVCIENITRQGTITVVTRKVTCRRCGCSAEFRCDKISTSTDAIERWQDEHYCYLD